MGDTSVHTSVYCVEFELVDNFAVYADSTFYVCTENMTFVTWFWNMTWQHKLVEGPVYGLLFQVFRTVTAFQPLEIGFGP